MPVNFCYSQTMFFKLFLLFTIVPIIELTLLVKIGMEIGIYYTVLLVLGTAFIGAYMAKMEGLGVIVRFQRNMLEGIFPAEEMIDGAMLLVAGALLITPGILTDVVGFLLVIPSTRAVIKVWLKRYMKGRFDRMTIHRI
ncbi:MAG: FxsA family protein [Deltaproteobacteria bacterium]|nr:FxsA family protein [Deltaproteobacteria bacterium]